MPKEYIISKLKDSYIQLVKVASKQNCFQAGKIVYLMSFPNNDGGLIQSLGNTYGKENILICYEKNCQQEAQWFADEGYSIRGLKPSVTLFRKTLKEVSSANWIICDNYFPILSGLNLSPQTKVIQIWHAVGAVKKFGWDDPATLLRSKGDQERFAEVYKRFDYYVVGSDKMAEVFKSSYQASSDQMLKFGFPRVDELYQNQVLVSDEVTDQVLYAPTYRDDNQIISETLQALNQYARETKKKITYMLHPVTRSKLSDLSSYDCLAEVSVTDSSYLELYKQVGYLISDYSSVVFDYALLNPQGKIKFYWPDFDEYNQKTGIQDTFKESYLENSASTVTELIEALENEESIDVAELNQIWNQYNDGKAIDRLIEFIK